MSKLPTFSSKAFLAPMAGISDPALRLLCKKYGAGLVFTEFTSIHSIVAKEKELSSQDLDITDFVQFSERERPLSIQLFGSDLNALSKAATIVEPHFDIIDYNMGCPAPHITQQMAGGALLQESNLTRKIFRTLVDAVDKPVTLKMRAGVTSASRHLFLDIAKIAQEEGIQMITLHPRTVQQGYSGVADWSLIQKLKSVSNIPIVGNGDIDSPEKAKLMLEKTGCDYVMIGRGAMGNPLLFEQINDFLYTGRYTDYSIGRRIELFFEYLNHAKQYNIKFSRIKAHAMNFTKGAVGASRLRAKITSSKSTGDLQNILKISVSSP